MFSFISFVGKSFDCLILIGIFIMNRCIFNVDFFPRLVSIKNYYALNTVRIENYMINKSGNTKG